MTNKVTVFAPVVLAAGVTEDKFLKASEKFQKEFVDLQPGVLRRELVKEGDGRYIDIVLFRSQADADDVMKKEMESQICAEFFSVMDMSQEVDIKTYQSLEIFQK